MPKKKSKREYIVIPGDPVSREDLLRQLDTERISHLKFEMEKIRTSDLDPFQKRIKTSSLMWQLRALENKMNERS